MKPGCRFLAIDRSFSGAGELHLSIRVSGGAPRAPVTRQEGNPAVPCTCQASRFHPTTSISFSALGHPSGGRESAIQCKQTQSMNRRKLAPSKQTNPNKKLRVASQIKSLRLKE